MDYEKAAMQRRIDNLMEQLELVKRQRDAAINDLRCNTRCTACKNNSNILTMGEPCKSCRKLPATSADAWEWRGLCKENGGVEE